MTSATLRRPRGAALPPLPLGAVLGLGAALAIVGCALAITIGNPLLLLAAGIAATVVFVVSILVRPDVATLAVVVLVYSNAPVVGAQFHGVPYLVAALLPGLLLVPIADRIVYGRQAFVLPPTLPFVLAFLLVEILSTLASRDSAAASAELVRMATEGVLLYLLVVNAVRNVAVLRVVMVGLAVSAAGLATLSVIQLAVAPENAFFGLAQIEGLGFDPGTGAPIQQRVSGPIGEKNFYAQMLLAVVPIALALGRGRGAGLRFLAIGAALLIGLGVVLTFSRGAAVAAGILVVVGVMLRIVRPRLVLGLALAGAVVVAAVPSYAARLGTLSGIGGALEVSADVDPVLAQRANDALAATAAFVDHPILGVGPGLFAATYREYAGRVAGLPGDLDYAAHNLYLEIASETGIAGFVAFGGIIGCTLLWLFRARRSARSDPSLVAMADAFILVVISYLATGLFLHVSYQRYLWMFLALSIVAALVIRRSAEATRPGDGP